MSAPDPEIEELRAAVTCSVVLEAARFKLDREESSRKQLKFRRGKGEIIIVNHNERGWWDPTRAGVKGDVFSLAQHLFGGNFGHARMRLRGLVGTKASYAPLPKPRRARPPGSMGDRWTRLANPNGNSPSWRYLATERHLPAATLTAALQRDVWRSGPYGSAWFAHKSATGEITGWEMRGPRFRGFTAGGTKTLFTLSGTDQPTRIAVCEAAIDALSLAAIEGFRQDTHYCSTGGGFGPHTADVLRQIASRLGSQNVVIIGATDNDAAGGRLADAIAELARSAGLKYQRLNPSPAQDWNARLRPRAQPTDPPAIASGKFPAAPNESRTGHRLPTTRGRAAGGPKRQGFVAVAPARARALDPAARPQPGDP